MRFNNEILHSCIIWWGSLSSNFTNSKNISRKFRTNRNSPQPFIPLISIENPDLDKLYPLVDKLIAPYKTFRVNANDTVYPLDQTKSIN